MLWISQKDFTRFVRAFPFLENYFKEYIDETFGGTEELFAPGSANHELELEFDPDQSGAGARAQYSRLSQRESGNLRPSKFSTEAHD